MVHLLQTDVSKYWYNTSHCRLLSSPNNVGYKWPPPYLDILQARALCSSVPGAERGKCEPSVSELDRVCEGEGTRKWGAAWIITSGHSTSAGPEHSPWYLHSSSMFYIRGRRGSGLFWRQKSFSLWQNPGRKNNRNKHLYNIAIAWYLISNSNMEHSVPRHLLSVPAWVKLYWRASPKHV